MARLPNTPPADEEVLSFFPLASFILLFFLFTKGRGIPLSCATFFFFSRWFQNKGRDFSLVSFFFPCARQTTFSFSPTLEKKPPLPRSYVGDETFSPPSNYRLYGISPLFPLRREVPPFGGSFCRREPLFFSLALKKSRRKLPYFSFFSALAP